MTSNNDKVEDVSYSYATDVNGLEEENRFLRESVGNLERELEKFRKAPLIACEIRDLLENKALVRLPNGNEFFVEVASECDTLIPGDSVLAEQKNLTIVRKIPSGKKFDVFVI